MKAQTLTISVPSDKCDKNCEYCISRMTGYIEYDPYMFFRNLDKIKTISKAAGVSTVLLTSKKEPLLNFDMVGTIISRFKEFPIEIQTNGIWLNNNYSRSVKVLQNDGIDIIAVSIDHLSQMTHFRKMFEEIKNSHLTLRICLNLTNKISDNIMFTDVMSIMLDHNIDQLLIRNITTPEFITGIHGGYGAEAKKTAHWIKKNTDPARYKLWYDHFMSMIENKDLIRTLPHGTQVFDFKGIAVSFSDYCIQEANNTEDIRSLIYTEDGHCYTTWDKKSSILF